MTARASELGYPTLDVMIDIDDVIMPWFETVDGHLVEAWGQPAEPCRIWSMYDHYGKTREEWSLIVARAVDAGLYTHTEPLPGAAEAVRRIHFAGHRIHIVTARGFMERGTQIRGWTREYLERFAIPHDTLTFAKDKVEAMEALEVFFDHAVDDGVHNFEHLRDAGVNAHLHDAPHNADYALAADRRVSSLWEFANIVLGKDKL